MNRRVILLLALLSVACGGADDTDAGPLFDAGSEGHDSTFVFPDYESITRDRATLDDEGVPLGWEPPADVVNDAGYSRLEPYLAQLAGDFHVLRAAR